MKKTDKTMTELQIELNKSWEFDKITEAGGAVWIQLCTLKYVVYPS